MEISSHTVSGSSNVDLHVHSDASDGSLSVAQIIHLANRTGLGAISITDHDTVEGVCEVLENPALSSTFLEIIPGIEISALHPCGGMHILGYLMDPRAQSLNKTLTLLQDAREDRNLKIVENLQGLGIDISYDEIKTIAVHGQVGRPHFAQALVKKGVIRTVEEGFQRFLKGGRPGYAPKHRLMFTEAIGTILDAGGIPVLAHPNSLGIRREWEMEKILIELKEAGLQGMEVYYPDHSPRQQAMYEQLAHRHGFVMTGGTDFHGAAKPGIRLGVGTGSLRIPYSCVTALKARKGV